MPNSITHHPMLPSTQEKGLLMISEILDSPPLFWVLMGRRGSDNQAANCSAYQKMVFHCSVYVGSGCFRRQSYPGVCGLAVTGSQWRDQGSERSEGGQGQWNALKIIFCSYQRHVFPTHILNVLELITLESKIAVSVFWAPRKADSGSGS